MAAHKYVGNATTAARTLQALTAISPGTSGTFSIDVATNYPSGGEFVVEVDYGQSTPEKILVTRSGTTLTVVTRGYDDTTATSHTISAPIRHVWDAASAQRHEDHVADTAADDHTQYQKKSLLTAAGDMIYATATSVWARLAKGTANQPLTMNDAATAPQWGGTMNLGDSFLVRPTLKDVGEEVNAHGATGATETIDMENGNVHTVTLDTNCVFTFSNPTATGDCCSVTLIVLQDATGSRTVTWPASVKWAAGVTPVLTTTASRYDIFTFVTVDAGTRWFGFTAGLNYQ